MNGIQGYGETYTKIIDLLMHKTVRRYKKCIKKDLLTHKCSLGPESSKVSGEMYSRRREIRWKILTTPDVFSCDDSC